MNSRMKKFLSYYKPYLRLFYADMACAVTVSAITLALPLCIRYITQNLLSPDTPQRLSQIYMMGAVMLALVLLYTACNAFVSYKGHLMGARMEADMRNELFDHYQKLSFNFYDEHRTGQLMTRISNDTFDLSELYHHGPEDIVIASMNFIGACIILININVKLALIVLLFIPIMGLYAFYSSKRMRAALRKSNDRIGDINAQVEDTLSGIRVVKSFTNEAIEKKKFAYENSRFVESRKAAYKSESYFYDGLIMLTQLMTVAVVIFGAVAIVKSSLDLADLLTFILYIVILIEPIQRLGNFARLYQEGITGFERFMEMLEIEPDIKDLKGATELVQSQGALEFKNVSFKYKEGYDHVLPDAREDKIIAAAKKANAHDFIMALPNGYATDIGQRGVKLSGGQKQRLSIARVFLKNPPIIIFDEATSALDNESEKAVQDSLETLTSNRTTIVIAHRLSTVKNAERIIVLTDSGVDEQGTHEELIALNGAYANLYTMQLRI